MSRPIREQRRQTQSEEDASKRVANWKQPVSKAYRDNFDRIFGQKEPGRTVKHGTR